MRLRVHEIDRPLFRCGARASSVRSRAANTQARENRRRRTAAAASRATSQPNRGLRAEIQVAAARRSRERSPSARARSIRYSSEYSRAPTSHARMTRHSPRSSKRRFLFAQLEALNFSGRGLRQLGDELEKARVLVWRQLSFDERFQLVFEFGRSTLALFSTTKALVLVRPSVSALPITAASSTAECCINAASTSNGETYWPLTRNMSSLRPA